MPKYQQGDEQISDGVNLLISILVRYPEVGSITYNPAAQSIKLTFLLTASPEKRQVADLTNHILSSLTTYHVLKDEKSNISRFI